MGIFGGLARAGAKAYIGHKTGKLQGEEARRARKDEEERRRLAQIEEEDRAAAAERDAILDSLNIYTKQREIEDPLHDLPEYEKREEIRQRLQQKYGNQPRTPYSERRDQQMLAYRDQLVAKGMPIDKANEEARKKFMREKSSVDDLAALLGAYGASRQPATP